MNLTAYHPLGQFDLLAIGVALVVVMAIIGWRILTGRPWRRTLPPDEIDVSPRYPAQLPQNKDNRHDL